MHGGRTPASTPTRTSAAMRSSVAAARADPSMRRAGTGTSWDEIAEAPRRSTRSAGTPWWSSTCAGRAIHGTGSPFSGRSREPGMIDAAGTAGDRRELAMPATGAQHVLHLDGPDGPVTAVVAELAASLRRVR